MNRERRIIEMPEMLYFRDAEKVFKQKKISRDIHATLEYVEDVLYGSLHRGELLRQALDEMQWRENGNGELKILDDRRYMYKGVKRGVAIEGNFSSYEYILEGLLRLQIGFDKGKIETGVLMLTGLRSEKSAYGSSADLAKAEVEMLYPTISLPVAVAIFDLGQSMILDEGGDRNGVSVQANDN